ncbi:MAG: ComEA family DNA-binding protein [Erysipelotrichia bacterium]|jgi:competence protein ComEA|nr:ComEA family DNA-binding protein [Erysipelotrichia bacterium]
MKIYPVFLLFILMACHPFQPLEIKPSLMMNIHVSGAVKQEMWIEVPNLSTFEEIKDLIHFREDADLSNIHPSQILRHHDRLIIPSIKATPCISLNTDSLEELMLLNGIGQVSAQRILEYRQVHGLFRRVEDVMNVKGIKEKTFNKFKDQLCL